MNSIFVAYADFLKTLDCASRLYLAEKLRQTILPVDMDDWQEVMALYFPKENLCGLSADVPIDLSHEERPLLYIDLVEQYLKSA